MATPDFNVLVAAFRPSHEQHKQARTWLTGALESCASGGTVELLPMVVASFLRLVTNRKVFPDPDSPGEAAAFLKSLTVVPGVTVQHLGPEWPTFERLCVELGLAGDDIPDAWIAAAVIASGLHLVTFDTDFERLLRPSQYTLLSRTLGIAESRPRYGARMRKSRRRRKARRAA